MGNRTPLPASGTGSRHSLVQKAGIALLRTVAGEKEVLLVQQNNGQWSLPKGKCRPGEPVKEACLRECREETGYEPSRVFFVASGMNSRKSIRFYLWKSEVRRPYPTNNGIGSRRKEIRRISWFSPMRAHRVLKPWQWNLLVNALRRRPANLARPR